MNPGTTAESEFKSKGLDVAIDLPARCATSLFKLLTRVAVDARLIRGGKDAPGDGTLRLWANGPGHNSAETFTLALLSLCLVSGLTAAAIIDAGSGRWWAWLIAIPLAPFLAFVALHLLAFGSALCGMGLRKLGIAAHLGHSQVTLYLSLLFLTAIAIPAAFSGCPLRIAAAAPWLLWAALNLIAWAALIAGSLVTALNSLGSSPSQDPANE